MAKTPPYPGPLPRIDVDEARRLYVEDGLSFAEVARRTGHTQSSIRKRLLEAGVESRPRVRTWTNEDRALRAVWRRLVRRQERDPRAIEAGSEWEDPTAFITWSRAHGYRSDRALIRLDEQRPYGPRNCAFVSKGEALQRRMETVRNARSGMRPVPKEIDWKNVVRRHRVEGLAASAIARELGVPPGRIVRGLRRLGEYQAVTPRKWEGTRDEIGHRLYEVWRHIPARCSNVNHPLYRYYGGVGVRVCRAWESFDVFQEWARANGYRPGMWLTRKRRRGPYSPANCQWDEPGPAAQRIRRSPEPGKPRWTVTAFGEAKGQTAWARDPRCRVKATELGRRLRRGMDPEEAITTPPKHGGPGRPSVFIEAFGERKCAAEWHRDPRCSRITLFTLIARIRDGVDPETAITAPRGMAHRELGKEKPTQQRETRRRRKA